MEKRGEKKSGGNQNSRWCWPREPSAPSSRCMREAAIDVICGSCSATLIGSTHRTGLASFHGPLCGSTRARAGRASSTKASSGPNRSTPASPCAVSSCPHHALRRYNMHISQYLRETSPGRRKALRRGLFFQQAPRLRGFLNKAIRRPQHVEDRRLGMRGQSWTCAS